jgi:hypothetical protein
MSQSNNALSNAVQNLDIAHTWTENLDIAHTWTENLDIAHTWTEKLDTKLIHN